MFTGIIEEMGTVQTIKQSGRSLHLTVTAGAAPAALHPGDSIAVNGVCLTVIAQNADTFTADIMPETWDKTALGRLRAGDAVNLEKALTAGAPLGGHIVQGHVDGIGTILSIEPEEIARLVTIAAPAAITRYIVPKGSITVDGVSLTVIGTEDDRFSIGIIPHTWAVTTIGRRQPGDAVNLEVDIVGKYVEKFVAAYLSAPPGQP